MDFLTALQNTPLPTLLVVAGFVFLFLGVATVKKPIVIDVSPSGRRVSFILGIFFIATGLYFLIKPMPGEVSNAASIDSSSSVNPMLTSFPSIETTLTSTPSYASVFVGISENLQFREDWIWHSYFCLVGEMCDVGDFNGDRKSDIITFVGDGRVFVALSDGTKFGDGVQWSGWFCVTGEQCVVGDVNGDGKSDIITFVGDGRVFVALSDGTKFGDGAQWNGWFCMTGEQCAIGDVNGDGKSDIITFVGDGRVFVALSDGTKFGDGAQWISGFCLNKEICRVGDVDGDKKVDIITFLHDANGNVYVALSNGAKFGDGQYGTIWNDSFCTKNEICSVGDVNGDGRVDLVAFQHEYKP